MLRPSPVTDGSRFSVIDRILVSFFHFIYYKIRIVSRQWRTPKVRLGYFFQVNKLNSGIFKCLRANIKFPKFDKSDSFLPQMLVSLAFSVLAIIFLDSVIWFLISLNFCDFSSIIR